METARGNIPHQEDISLKKLEKEGGEKKPLRPHELPPLKEATQMKQKLIHVSTQNQKKESDKPLGEVFATGPAVPDSPKSLKKTSSKLGSSVIKAKPEVEQTTILPFEEVKSSDPPTQEMSFPQLDQGAIKVEDHSVTKEDKAAVEESKEEQARQRRELEKHWEETKLRLQQEDEIERRLLEQKSKEALIEHQKSKSDLIDGGAMSVNSSTENFTKGYLDGLMSGNFLIN